MSTRSQRTERCSASLAPELADHDVLWLGVCRVRHRRVLPPRRGLAAVDIAAH